MPGLACFLCTDRAGTATGTAINIHGDATVVVCPKPRAASACKTNDHPFVRSRAIPPPRPPSIIGAARSGSHPEGGVAKRSTAPARLTERARRHAHRVGFRGQTRVSPANARQRRNASDNRTPGLNPRPQPQASTPGLNPRPQPQASTPGLNPRPQPQASTPGLNPRPQPQASTPGLNPRPQPQASTPGLNPRPQPQASTPGLRPILICS